jgi:Uma2 family endonuclease
MVAKRSPYYYTPEEYLRQEDQSEYKHEYYNGEIYMMSGGTPRHNFIAVNVSSEVNVGLRPKPCYTYDSDMKVSNKERNFTYYPDVSVVCGEPEMLAGRRDVITNPILVIEVLSPSTARFDRGEKFEMYRLLPSLQHFVLIEQAKVLVEHYRKESENQWHFETLNNINQTLKIAALDLEIPLKYIYDKVNFNADE